MQKKLKKLGFVTKEKVRQKPLRRGNSFFGECLMHRQILKGHYHRVRDYYLKNLINRLRSRGTPNLQQQFLSVLERRLDSFVYRTGVVPTHAAAAQLVSHGHCRVNGSRVNVRSYVLKVGDAVNFAPGAVVSRGPVDLPPYIEPKEDGFVLVKEPTTETINYQVAFDVDRIVSSLLR